MENNTNKSQAEIYREERKARLAKAAAKKAKKSPKFSKAKRVAGKVIAVVLAVVLVFGAVGGILNFFGVPQKVIKISADESIKFSLAEYNYYYYITWSNYQQTAYQYDSSYGAGTGLQLLGYDYTKAPDAQDYTDDYSGMTGVTVADLGVTNPKWSDAFRYSAVNQLIQIKYGAMKAAEADITMTQEEQTELDDAVEELRESAEQNDYSLDRYMRATFGNGISEKIYRQIMTESYLATAYFEKLQEDMDAAITDDQINEKYNSDKSSYDIVSVRLYEFSTETPDYEDGATEDEKAEILQAAQDKVKAEADKFMADATDEEKFISLAKAAILSEDSESETDADSATDYSDCTYATFTAKSEDLAKWIYDEARAVGDKTVIEVSDGVYDVVMITVLPHKDMSPVSNDVRHILVAFPTDDDGNTVELTDEEKAEYKETAQAILDEYLENPTEEHFSELAKEKSEDPGSASEGGLIEGITEESSYVENFLNWSVDSSRKAGDTGIVETEYGYHVMYYKGANGVAWSDTVKNEILNEQYNDLFEKEIDPRMESVSLNSVFLRWATNSEDNHISSIILANY